MWMWSAIRIGFAISHPSRGRLKVTPLMKYSRNIIPRSFWAILDFVANIHAEAWDYLGFLIDEVEYVGLKLKDQSTK
jgi:hypothetical protein